MPSSPPLSGSAIVASGTVTFSIAPGETKKFEPAELASTQGATAPPSARLVWTVVWRATAVLSAAWYSQDALTELGEGRWGTAELGPAGFELRNAGAVDVSGELAFVIGSR